jgi:hypothetical protein
MIPDVTLLAVYGMLSTVTYIMIRVSKDRSFAFLLDRDPSAGSRLICLAMPFVFSVGIVVFVHNQYLFLPRYIVPMLPFALAAILLLANLIRGDRAVFFLLVASCALFVLNFDGRLYPPNYGSFSIVERSHAYRDFLHLQTDAIDALATMPTTLPAFVSREIGYMASHRLMGYIENEMPQMQPIYLPPHRDRSLGEFPKEFLLLYTNPGHGGQEIARLVKEARRMPQTGIRTRLFERAGFRGALYWIRQDGFEHHGPAEAPTSTLPN